MQRILILGPPGSGKSTVARVVGKITELPVIHLDQHYWQPGWVEIDHTQWRQKITELIASPTWIIDGNYSGTLDKRLALADTLILLDVPRWKCLLRILWRSLWWLGRTRNDMTPGCVERLNWDFLEYAWHFHSREWPIIFEIFQSFKGHKFRVRLQQDIKAILSSL